MTKLNYMGMLDRLQAAQKLYKLCMSGETTILDAKVNPLNQIVIYLEHPINGEDSPVICAFPEIGLAFPSDFYETDDMVASHQEYAPCYRHDDVQMVYYFQMEGNYE